MRVALHCRALHAHSEPARDNSAFVVFAGSHRAPASGITPRPAGLTPAVPAVVRFE